MAGRDRPAGHLPPVAVIGGGFSGTMVALRLARGLPPGQDVLLCEGAELCQGAAYATRNAAHLLNVRAANMSAFPEEPEHFETWLTAQADIAAGQGLQTDAGRFVSRAVYGRYLRGLLDEAIAGDAGRLLTLPREIVDLERDGRGFRLLAADGTTTQAAAVVIAVGNLPPVPAACGLHVTNPWSPGTVQGLLADLPVLILGTGLTMVDLLLDLREAGFAGPVTALSRRGLLPHAHAGVQSWPTPVLSPGERASLALLLGRVRWEVARARAQGVDWRAVVDSLRPLTAEIWRSLAPADRNRFLRHLRPYWDVHRHRLAAPVAAELAAMQESGFLERQRGRVLDLRFDAGHVVATIRRHGEAVPQVRIFQRVINATGLQTAARADSALVRALLRRRLARLDAWEYGLDVTDGLEVRDPAGRVVPRLWALGPIVRGVFWECIAVPDIRVQARLVAERVCQALAGTATAA